MRLRFWKRRPQAMREISGFRLLYDGRRRLFSTASDGSRWRVPPGGRVASFSPPADIKVDCTGEMLCEGIEGIETDATVDYADDLTLTVTLTDGEKWEIAPGVTLTVRGVGTLDPNGLGELIEDGPASSTEGKR